MKLRYYARIITSICPSETGTFGGERFTARLDRLTHVHILEINGQSYWLSQSRTRRAAPNA